MDRVTVAVVGAGASGLAALKCLREEGFAATAFEGRDDIGGIWYHSPEKGITSCLTDTVLNSSKFISHYSDFPFPPDYPTYPPAHQMREYFNLYAEKFSLHKHIEFNTKVTSIIRNESSGKWVLTLESGGEVTTKEFDKVVMAGGPVQTPRTVKLPREDEFEGIILNGRDYKSSTPLKGKKVVVVGFGNTGADVAVDLSKAASKVYLSHRRGQIILSRYRNGVPVEFTVNYHAFMIINRLQDRFPKFTATRIIDAFLKRAMDNAWEIDPAWNIKPVPSIYDTLPCINEDLIPCLAAGTVESVVGAKQFLGPKSIELTDGTVLDDIDAVVFATGYFKDTSTTPWLRKSKPPGYEGPPMPRLFHQVFPPEYADSFAFINIAGATDCYWVVSELVSMAIAQLWQGNSEFPSQKLMEAEVDALHADNAPRWRKDRAIEGGDVQPGQFYHFMHTAAGTGIPQALGWGAAGWRFWWTEREMSRLMGHGILSPHTSRVIETGKRKAWDGAREALRRSNEEAKKIDTKPNKFKLSDVRRET